MHGRLNDLVLLVVFSKFKLTYDSQYVVYPMSCWFDDLGLRLKNLLSYGGIRLETYYVVSILVLGQFILSLVSTIIEAAC